MDCPPPRKIKFGKYNVAYFQYHIDRLENDVVSLTQKLSTHESTTQHIQRKLKCRELQLEQYKKRIVKLQDTNQQFQQKLEATTKAVETVQHENKMLNDKLKIEKQIHQTKIFELNQIINDFKQQLKLQSQIIKTHREVILEQKTIINNINDSDESDGESVISTAQCDSSSSKSLTPNTQDKLFTATPDEIDKAVLSEDRDYDPKSDVDGSFSSDVDESLSSDVDESLFSDD